MDPSHKSMLLVVLVAVVVGCRDTGLNRGQQSQPVAQGSSTPEVVGDTKNPSTAAKPSGAPGRAAIKYPYIASSDRKKQIREGYTRIKPGMSQKDVTAILSQPDDEKALYEPKIKNAKRIGSTYWYLVERKSESLSDAELVRVSFDLKRRVTDIDLWGFDDTDGGN